MKFIIRHELKGRLRVHLAMSRMSCREADTLVYYLNTLDFVTGAKAYERTADASVTYIGDRQRMLDALRRFHFETAQVPETVFESSGREMNGYYKEKITNKVILRAGTVLFLPAPVRAALTIVRAAKYIWKGLCSLARGRIEVSVLDATAIAVSVLQGNTDTAGSVMFLLGIGEILEEWTHKKSVNDLARSMSLNVSRVWLCSGGQEILTDADKVQPGDHVLVHMGNVIPFDGTVVSGEGMVNQASLTGESMPVHKTVSGYVYAGTVLEEGELVFEVKQSSGASRYEQIVTMIEDTEKLKSAMESRAEHLADRLVPYTLAGTGLVWLLTRNTVKAMAVLMVDFSCALKLAMPITVLTAIREAGVHQITVKGGKFLEAVSEAETIVFDKTGTLTKAQPTVRQVVSFCEKPEDELLRIAACLEEHFPHSMAKAVVRAAQDRHLVHEEMHSRVEYIVAHGIVSTIDGERAVIGSAHFVFEDEGCRIDPDYQSRIDELAPEYSHLYLAINGWLAAVICVEDPLREEAPQVMRRLREAGFTKLVMMTGDSERTARAVARKIGVDEYYAEVLPEDKARFVEHERASGRKVLMIGDGINDSPALSAADVGIAISDGAEIAREIADVTISADNLEALVTLRKISDAMAARIHRNYRGIVGINGALIALGVAGVIQPTLSAALHNMSTLAISVDSMRNYVK